MILTIRTDKPEAEIGLFTDQGKQKAYYQWHAHRELADTLLITIQNQLHLQQLAFTDVKGIVIFQGPGSFTGLRIGIAVANAFAYAQSIPVVGVTGEEWIQNGLEALNRGQNDTVVLPEYGSEAHITLPKK